MADTELKNEGFHFHLYKDSTNTKAADIRKHWPNPWEKEVLLSSSNAGGSESPPYLVTSMSISSFKCTHTYICIYNIRMSQNP